LHQGKPGHYANQDQPLLENFHWHH